jgi:signal transduction histidine kinase/ActR/RegA family two-component response regulator
VFLAYIVPMLAPLSILWAVSAGTSSAWWIEGMTAVLIVFLALILFALSRDAFRLFKESFNIRLQQIHLNAKLSLALEHAEAASRAKTRFLASASHDLRQPMHTLSVFAAALAMRHLDARSHEIVTYMNEALEDLSSELDAILDISKLDAGVISIQKKAMALKPFLEHLRDTFLADARAKHLDLRIDCSDNFWVYTDKTALERVLRNLLQNAIKYTYSGHILLVVEVDGSSLLLTIADTGPGMSETEHMRIFEEFYQIDNPERDRQRGLGLGLAIVKRLLDLLEVEFRLISSPGFGTKFILKLPRVNTYDDIITESAISLSLSGLHILLVDDETKVRLGTKELLESSGCRVSDADGTAQAVMRALADPPDIVLADFRLRGTDDGITTVHTLRKIYPDLPALLVSGDTDPQRLREADAAGISLLHKPVSGKLLTKAIVMAVGGEMKNIA